MTPTPPQEQTERSVSTDSNTTTDEHIDLAMALEQRRALRIVEAVAALPFGGATAVALTRFQAGYQTACEEIAHRLRTEEWELCLTPPGEAVDEWPAPGRAPRMSEADLALYGAANDEAVSHLTDAPMTRTNPAVIAATLRASSAAARAQALQREVEELRAITCQCVQMRADALRYRWLRDRAPGEINFDYTLDESNGGHYFALYVPFDGREIPDDDISAATLNEAIDAAMAEEGNQ